PRDRVRRLGTRFTAITWPGDVITLSGQVTGKREEGGEKLIDLEVKCTNQNGQDTLQGHATVAAVYRGHQQGERANGSIGGQGGDRHRICARHRRGNSAPCA